MFQMEVKERRMAFTNLVLACLQEYASGFYLLVLEDDEDVLLYNNHSRITGCGVAPYSRYDFYHFSQKRAKGLPHRALVVVTGKGTLYCRAGGLSLTMLTEIVLLRYLQSYGELLEDPWMHLAPRQQMENAKELVKSIAKDNRIIRQLPRRQDKCYLGYVAHRLYEPKPDGYIDQVLFNCFGETKLQPGRYAYTYEDLTEGAELNLYMLNNPCDLKNYQPLPREKWPPVLLPQLELKGLRNIQPRENNGWYALSACLRIGGQLHITSGEKFETDTCLPAEKGRYFVLWHQQEEVTDHVQFLRIPESQQAKVSVFSISSSLGANIDTVETQKKSAISSRSSTAFSYEDLVWNLSQTFEVDGAVRCLVPPHQDASIQVAVTSYRLFCPRGEVEHTLGLFGEKCEEFDGLPPDTTVGKECHGIQAVYRGKTLVGVRFPRMAKNDFRTGISRVCPFDPQKHTPQTQHFCFYINQPKSR